MYGKVMCRSAAYEVNSLCDSLIVCASITNQDLSWLQNWYYPGHIFGFLAILWSFFMVVKALCHGFHEVSGNTHVAAAYTP